MLCTFSNSVLFSRFVFVLCGFVGYYVFVSCGFVGY